MATGGGSARLADILPDHPGEFFVWPKRCRGGSGVDSEAIFGVGIFGFGDAPFEGSASWTGGCPSCHSHDIAVPSLGGEHHQLKQPVDHDPVHRDPLAAAPGDTRYPHFTRHSDTSLRPR